MRRADPRTRPFLSLCWLVVACATSPASERREPSTEHDFVVETDPSLAKKPADQRAAWLAYGVARVAAYRELEATRRNTAADDYLIELRARAALADTWRTLRDQPDATHDAYLDRLVAVSEAGQLEEHVLGSLVQPGWTIPAAELASIDFAALDASIPRNETPTHATAYRRGAPRASAIPGYDLPDPLELHPQRVPCTESLPKLRRALGDWEAQQSRLDGAPAPANSDTELRALLAAARNEPVFRARGATWVSPRAFWLYFVAGFCANELEDYRAAERWLESAVAMSPEIQAQMELAHALAFLRKFDRVDAIVDSVLARSQDRCDLARAWRRRGYIRFEQRRLDDSRDAYLRSLEYDPDSAIARSELDLLRKEAEKNGGSPQWYVPPPTTQHVTTCPTGA